MQSLHGRRPFFIFDRDSASPGVCAAHALTLKLLQFQNSLMTAHCHLDSWCARMGFCISDLRSELSAIERKLPSVFN